MHPLTISVIVPHLNQPTDLARCLEALTVQTGEFALAEVIVVDNGSRVPPAEICGRFPGVALLSEPRPGPGPARNTGVRASTGEILAFIDADCHARADWLAEMSRNFRTRPGIDILGGSVRIPRSSAQRLSALEAYESVYAYRIAEYIARHGFAGTGNLAIRRAVFDQVGPFGGIGISEDLDWGVRATGLGHRVEYVPDMVVYHPARTSFAELRKKWDRHIAHDYAAMRSRPLWRARFTFRAAAIGLSPLWELPRILTARQISSPRERRLAFGCLVRIRLYRAWRMLRLLASGDKDALLSAWNRS